MGIYDSERVTGNPETDPLPEFPGSGSRALAQIARQLEKRKIQSRRERVVFDFVCGQMFADFFPHCDPEVLHRRAIVVWGAKNLCGGCRPLAPHTFP